MSILCILLGLNLCFRIHCSSILHVLYLCFVIHCSYSVMNLWKNRDCVNSKLQSKHDIDKILTKNRFYTILWCREKKCLVCVKYMYFIVEYYPLYLIQALFIHFSKRWADRLFWADGTKPWEWPLVHGDKSTIQSLQ